VTHILNVRHWAAPDYSRVVFDTSEEAKYTVSKEGKKITIDFENAIVDEEVPLQSFLNKPGIEKIVVMALPGDTARSRSICWTMWRPRSSGSNNYSITRPHRRGYRTPRSGKAGE